MQSVNCASTLEADSWPATALSLLGQNAFWIEISVSFETASWNRMENCQYSWHVLLLYPLKKKKYFHEIDGYALFTGLQHKWKF